MKLSLRILRELERKLGVFISVPKFLSRSSGQQFGILDPNECWVGDVVSEREFFTANELEEKILSLRDAYLRSRS